MANSLYKEAFLYGDTLIIIVVINLVKKYNQGKDERCILFIVYRNTVRIGEREPFFRYDRNGRTIFKDGEIIGPKVTADIIIAEYARDIKTWPEQRKILFHPGYRVTVLIDGVFG